MRRAAKARRSDLVVSCAREFCSPFRPFQFRFWQVSAIGLDFLLDIEFCFQSLPPVLCEPTFFTFRIDVPVGRLVHQTPRILTLAPPGKRVFTRANKHWRRSQTINLRAVVNCAPHSINVKISQAYAFSFSCGPKCLFVWGTGLEIHGVPAAYHQHVPFQVVTSLGLRPASF